MDKSKTIKVLKTVGKYAGITVVLVLPFFVSIATGVLTTLFAGLGWALGFCSKTAKIEKAFLDKLLENKEDFLNGKIIKMDLNDAGEIVVSISNAKKSKNKVAEIVD